MEAFKKRLKKVGSAVLATLSTVYLLNPTAGVIELIPDNLPILGNLDEAIATVLIIFSLHMLGIPILPTPKVEIDQTEQAKQAEADTTE